VCIGPKRDKQDAADSAGQARGTEREKGTAAHTHSHILFGRKCVELASEKSGLEREEEIERERER